MLNVIAAAARDPNTDVTKLEALLRMQREVMADQAKVAFIQARHRLKQKLPAVSKDGTIDLGVDKQSGKARGSMKFARWEDMARIIEPLMGEEGFTLSFNTKPRAGDGGGATIVGTLTHIQGHGEEAEIPLPLDSGAGRNNLQAMGSTISYGKRYVAEMLLNIVRKGEDDDGVAGGTRYITDEQKGELVSLIQETNTDTVNFLRTFGIETGGIDALEVGAFMAAKNMLLAKKNKKSGSGQ